MLTHEAIQKIADLSTTTTYEVDGRTVSSRPLHNLPLPTEPGYPTLYLSTLAGLVAFVKKEWPYNGPKQNVEIVVQATKVSLIGAPFGMNRQRDVFAEVNCKVEPFTFGNYRDLESFRVILMSRFERTSDSAAILEFIAKLNNEASKTITDSGVSQTVTARVGVATMGTVDVPSPCRLKPIRTFVEIEQPEGVFIFRLRKGAAGPEAALFEVFTDWERQAVMRIHDYLAKFKELEGVAIYA